MIYIIGAGGFAREVLNILIDLKINQEVAGFLEDNCERKGSLLNDIKIDDTSILKGLEKTNVKLINAIGTPLRNRLMEHTKSAGYSYKTIIHSSVIDSRWVEYGEGCIICAGNILTSQISIGDFSIINLACTIGHDVKIGKYTTISPGVHISGKVTIGDGCFIGSGAVIVEKATIGNNSFIGAGAVVTGNIPDNSQAVGVPAKVIRQIDYSDWLRLI